MNIPRQRPIWCIVDAKENSVRIHIAGQKSDLDAVNPLHLSVKIDLATAEEGHQTYSLTSDHIKLPKNVRLLDVFPSAMEITLAEIMEKMVPITPQLVGKLPNNLQIKGIELKPNYVLVRYPSTFTKDKPINITTTPIHLDNISQNTSQLCQVVAPPSVKPHNKSWPDVSVSIILKPNDL